MPQKGLDLELSSVGAGSTGGTPGDGLGEPCLVNDSSLWGRGGKLWLDLRSSSKALGEDFRCRAALLGVLEMLRDGTWGGQLR